MKNFESLINNSKETYALAGNKVLKGELHCKIKIINTLLETIGKFGNDKRNIQPVSLLRFENDLTASPNTVIDGKTNPKPDEQQQIHYNKQQISSKELRKNIKKKGSNNHNNLILFTDGVYVPKQDHEQESLDKQKRCSKRNKGESSNTTTNA